MAKLQGTLLKEKESDKETADSKGAKAKHETFVVDEATKGVMDSINREICSAVSESIADNFSRSLNPVKEEIESLSGKIQLSLKDSARKSEEASQAQTEKLALLKQEMIESQTKTVSLVQETVEKIEKFEKKLIAILDNQGAILEKLNRIEADTAYLKQPLHKKLFGKETKNNEGA